MDRKDVLAISQIKIDQNAITPEKIFKHKMLAKWASALYTENSH